MTSPSDFYVPASQGRGGREGSVIFSQESNASLFVELISRWSMALGLIARVNEQRPRYVAG